MSKPSFFPIGSADLANVSGGQAAEPIMQFRLKEDTPLGGSVADKVGEAIGNHIKNEGKKRRDALADARKKRQQPSG